MKAIVQDRYGLPDVLELRDVDKPTVGDQDVLLRVRAASVNPYDWHIMTGIPYIARIVGRTMGFGLLGPLNEVRGWDVAGHVEAVGDGVRDLQPGDEVFGWCGEDGAFAEYVSVPEDAVARKPAKLTMEEAASVPLAGFTALQALRDHGEVQPGQKVLINGASGGVGTFAVQIATSSGAEVTGVCSTRNVEMVRSIGADHVVDYTRDDFADGSERYDVLVDSAASRSLSDCMRALTPEGAYVNFGYPGGRWVGGFGRSLKMGALSPFVSQRMREFVARPTREDLVVLKDLIEAGNVAPVIDRAYPLSETPDALRYVLEGHARGKVVVTVEHGDGTQQIRRH